MWKELTACLDALVKDEKRLYVWFRDDDVICLSDRLRALLDLFSRRSLPVLLAIIPALLEQKDVPALLAYENVSFGQHGYAHVNHAEQANYQSELCICYGMERIEREQCKGRNVMRKNFGGRYTDVFIPPWFEWDGGVRAMLEMKGYASFSSWWTNGHSPAGIPDVNVQIDLIDWDTRQSFAGEDYVLKQLVRECNLLLDKEKGCKAAVGIVIHHDFTDEVTLSFLDRLLDVLGAYAAVSLCGEEAVRNLLAIGAF